LWKAESCKTVAVIDTIMNASRNVTRAGIRILAIGGGASRRSRLCRAVVTGAAAHTNADDYSGQNDAGVGVKNGINALGRKNFIGTFAPPFAVINDFAFLDTLPPRELRAGMAEAVKVALIKDRSFFTHLYEQRFELASFSPRPLEEMIHRCAALHMHHIGTGGDPFELGSARPLDFGHWSAHKLEEMTGGLLRHGEAVSIGIALDSLYSYYNGMIEEVMRQIYPAWRFGLPLYHPALLQLTSALPSMNSGSIWRGVITLPTGIGSKKRLTGSRYP
jgi:3-dehydroquinate synthase